MNDRTTPAPVTELPGLQAAHARLPGYATSEQDEFTVDQDTLNRVASVSPDEFPDVLAGMTLEQLHTLGHHAGAIAVEHARRAKSARAVQERIAQRLAEVANTISIPEASAAEDRTTLPEYLDIVDGPKRSGRY